MKNKNRTASTLLMLSALCTVGVQSGLLAIIGSAVVMSSASAVESPQLQTGEKQAIQNAAIALYRKGFTFINQKNRVLTPFDLLVQTSGTRVYVVPPKSDPSFDSASVREHAYLVQFERPNGSESVVIHIMAFLRSNLETPVSFRSLTLNFPNNDQESAAQTLALQQAILSLELELCGCISNATQRARAEEIAKSMRGQVNLIASAVMLTGSVSFFAGMWMMGTSKAFGSSKWFGRLLVIGGLAVIVGGGIQIYVNESQD